ncbi:MAG: 1,6-anhydro-N-acetylmuramyl-L-alanine amidase AmpD [Pseudomonadales bacterium]
MAYALSNGRLEQAHFCASPNCDDRPPGCPIDLLVIHCIALPPASYGGPYIEQLFSNCLSPRAHPYFAEICALEVSAHFLVRRGGGLVQFVNCEQRAWHAGESSFEGRERCNDYSIGIELEGRDDGLFTGAQYRVLAALTHALQRSYRQISDNRIVGHEHIAPGRKTDPGSGFDWRHYRALLSFMPV